MRATAFFRRRPVEAAWVAFAAASVVAMVLWPTWETIPFHFVWISLTLLYGFRVWGPAATAVVLGVVVVVTGAAILIDAFEGIQLWGELFEVPLMSAMFLAMVWHARRRQEALRTAEHEAAQRAALLDRHERFLHDASHELRTPVTIARGHLEIAAREGHGSVPEISVALDELGRIEGIVERLLLLAKVGQPDFVVTVDIDAEGFLEDVFMRWSEVAPRSWRLGQLSAGTLRADPDALRNALDALLENAVRYTDVGSAIELRSQAREDELTIDVVDGGPGIPPDVLSRIFDRFGRGRCPDTRSGRGRAGPRDRRRNRTGPRRQLHGVHVVCWIRLQSERARLRRGARARARRDGAANVGGARSDTAGTALREASTTHTTAVGRPPTGTTLTTRFVKPATRTQSIGSSRLDLAVSGRLLRTVLRLCSCLPVPLHLCDSVDQGVEILVGQIVIVERVLRVAPRLLSLSFELLQPLSRPEHACGRRGRDRMRLAAVRAGSQASLLSHLRTRLSRCSCGHAPWHRAIDR